MKTNVERVNLLLSCLEPPIIPGSLGRVRLMHGLTMFCLTTVVSLDAIIESFIALLLQSVIFFTQGTVSNSTGRSF